MAAKATVNEEEIAPQRDEFAAANTDFSAINNDPTQGPLPRRRGRPPGSKNKTYGGKPVTGSTRSRSSNLENQIGAFLVTINMPLQLIPALQRDALDATEIQALAKAINEQCQTNATFRKYVEEALKIQGATSLVGVVAVIIARRAVRHNVVPIPADAPMNKDSVDALLGGLVSMMAGNGPFNPQSINTNLSEAA